MLEKHVQKYSFDVDGVCYKIFHLTHAPMLMFKCSCSFAHKITFLSLQGPRFILAPINKLVNGRNCANDFLFVWCFASSYSMLEMNIFMNSLGIKKVPNNPNMH
jgi:hypothetical protein